MEPDRGGSGGGSDGGEGCRQEKEKEKEDCTDNVGRKLENMLAYLCGMLSTKDYRCHTPIGPNMIPLMVVTSR